jgi:alkane 1-monooxygenase
MQSTRQAAGFALSFVPLILLPLSAAALEASLSPLLSVSFPLAFLFGIVPLLDALMGLDRSNVSDALAPALEDQIRFRLLTWLMVPAWLLHLVWAIGYAVAADFSAATLALWTVSLGVVGGVAAINTAHELIHKSGRFEPFLGGLLLSSVIYAGFKVEHVRGHHVHVSTPLDTSSARLGQSLYHFLPRALIGNAVRAWQLEAQRLRERGRPAWHGSNELLWWYGLSALMAIAIGLAFGGIAAAIFVLQGAIAGTTLEVINYVEHYGLERERLANGRYERVTHHHSWNASQRLTNGMLFQLQRHADHHAHPRRRFQALRHHDDSPQLPTGYAGMFVLALVPPLWRRVVDPLVREWRHQQR